MKWLCLAALAVGGCFSPDLGNGNLRCGPGQSCPPGLHCGTDNRCYQPGSGTRFGGTNDMGPCAPRHCFVGWCGMVDDGCGGTLDCGPCTLLDGGAGGTGGSGGGGGAGGGGGGGSGGSGGSGGGPAPPDMSTCVPTTCAAASATCGFYPDGCGHALDCYGASGDSCGPGNSNGTCGGGGPYTCGKKGKCNPLTQCPANACGDIPDGCSNLLHCGGCSGGRTCGGGGVPNICG